MNAVAGDRLGDTLTEIQAGHPKEREPMRCEIIAIGDELTSGQRVDTNSAWLSQELTSLGHKVSFHTTVGDDLDNTVEAFHRAASRADIIVSTGGLGPTADDLTREALARASGVDLVLDEPSLAHIRNLFARRGREMPERNRVQAMFPQGAMPIPNAHGTAPGIRFRIPSADGERKNASVFALPGVPAEMREMWRATVVPLLQAEFPRGRSVVCRVIKCFGGGESQVEQMLPDLIRRGRNPLVGITVHEATISLRIQAEGQSVAECQAAIDGVVETIHACLGPLVFGEGDDELPDVVARELIHREETLAVVELGTQGLLSHWLASAPESDQFFAGALVVGHSSSATAVLGKLSRAETSGGGPSTAADWASHARRLLGATYGLAIGAAPDDDFAERPDAEIAIALATPHGGQSRGVPYAGHPSIRSPRAAKTALDMLRHYLLEM